MLDFDYPKGSGLKPSKGCRGAEFDVDYKQNSRTHDMLDRRELLFQAAI